MAEGDLFTKEVAEEGEKQVDGLQGSKPLGVQGSALTTAALPPPPRESQFLWCGHKWRRLARRLVTLL